MVLEEEEEVALTKDQFLRFPRPSLSSRARLTKSPETYLAVRGERRELIYEAMLAAKRTSWRPGERIRVYRKADGTGGLVIDSEDGSHGPAASDPRDYDIDHYVRVLRGTFAERLSRALAPDVFGAVVADPEQPSLFELSLETARPILTHLEHEDRPTFESSGI